MKNQQALKLILVLMMSILPCFAQERPTNTNTGIKPPTSSSSSRAASPGGAKKSAVEDSIINLEKQAWEAVKNKDANGFNKLFAEDGLMIDSMGMTTRAAFIQTLPDLNITEYSLENLKVVMLDKDAAVVSYKANVKGSFKGQAFPPNPAYVSSTWVKRGGKWVAMFHQETMAQ
jgi:uncharacterized protein (TIGR02246 family)